MPAVAEAQDDDHLGHFDVRRAMRLLSHNVRTHTLREQPGSPGAAIRHDFYLLRARW
jgi:hypothetical protein